MKTFKLFFIAFLLSQSTIMFGQEQGSIPEVHPDLDNPKVQEAIRLIEDGKSDGALELYEKVFQSNNRKDIKDLFVYDMTRSGSGQIMDIMFNSKYGTQINEAISDIMSLDDSPSERFQKALVYYTAGMAVYKDPEEAKKYLNSPFHTFLQLVSAGWKRPIPLLSQAAIELYKLGFEDEHLDMNLIIDVFDYNLLEQGYFSASIISQLADGFYYDNTYGLPITADEQKEIDRHNEVSTTIMHYLLTAYPENAYTVMNDLWRSSLSSTSFNITHIEFNAGYADSLSSFISKLKGQEDIDYEDLKALEILYQSFYNKDSKNDLDDLIELFGDKEKAFEYLSDFLTREEESAYLDLLGVNPKWVNTFKEYIVKSPEQLSLAIRFSDEVDVLLSDNSVNTELLKESLDFMPEIIYAMESIAASEEIGEPGLAVYVLYQFVSKMNEIREHESFKNNRDIKYQQAQAKMAFELTYLKFKGIHSPTIIGINDIFDNWTKEEINFSSDKVETFLSEYLDIYTESEAAGGSMEQGIVIDALQDLAIKFELI